MAGGLAHAVAVASILAASGATGGGGDASAGCPAVPVPRNGSRLWLLDSLECLGGHRINVTGSPVLTDSPFGTRVGVHFDGVTDGFHLAVDPLAGIGSTWTAEIFFRPDPDGLAQQRMFHLQAENSTGGDAGRVLFEIRLPGVNGSDKNWGPGKGMWFADSFVAPSFLPKGAQAQFGVAHKHPVRSGSPGWYTFAATVGPDPIKHGVSSYAHFVNGKEEMRDLCCSGVDPDDPSNCKPCLAPLAFVAHEHGRASLGVRINDVCHFKGTIAAIRVTPRVLNPHELLVPPGVLS